MSDACRMCGQILAAPATGRPPDYCGTACRRSAEYAIKRQDRRIERLTDSLDGARLAMAVHDPDGFHYRDAERRSATLASLIAEAEAELRRLMGDPS